MTGSQASETGAAAPLEGVRVLDLADGSGAHCGRILADLGADVVKVEPPAGDPARGVGPFIADRPGPDRSLSWLALNVNKRGVTLSYEREGGPALLRRLVERADVLVESYPPGCFGPPLAEWSDQLIHTSITPYGQDGPLAKSPASDLEVTAASGALWLAGEPGRPPVRTSLPQSPFWAGMYAAMGTLLALCARGAHRRGQTVDTSAQASMATVHPPASVWADVLGEEHRRLGPYLLGRSIVGARFRNIWRCADGYVAFAVQGGPIGRHTGRMLAAWMAERGEVPEVIGAIDWDGFDNTTLRQEEIERIEDAIAPFLRTLTKAEFFAGVVARNMLGYPVSSVEDIYADEQLAARGFWQDIAVAEAAGTLRFPGGFALFDGERPRIRRPAPHLGEHNGEIYRGELGLAASDLAALREAGVL